MDPAFNPDQNFLTMLHTRAPITSMAIVLSVLSSMSPSWKRRGRTIFLFPLGYWMWAKEDGKSKLFLAAQLVRSVMPVFPAGQQVILLCDSWYPKKEVLELTEEFIA